ncbi:phosphate ABC transporter permease subunit PstC [Falsirhodobacter sp. alg1]|uniref:phosphate ABC transporter permease subunit PstC n=1 Tax=Falsirhodobacter sp. alg1 TaxID=1472418 RepID=UPI0005EE85B3|nr:phosphate ABC transporter permease subunit PstC [Falsirhodobacter sp. alg1]
MPLFWTFLIVLAIAALAFVLGRRGAVARTAGDSRQLHSLPSYYGWYSFILAAVPALVVMIMWIFVQPIVVEMRTVSALDLPEAVSTADQNAAMRQVRTVAMAVQDALASGAMTKDQLAAFATDPAPMGQALRDAGSSMLVTVTPTLYNAVDVYLGTSNMLAWIMTVVIIGLSLAGVFVAISRCRPDFRARNAVEKVTMSILVMASVIAIFTTVAIVVSMVFETTNFFSQHSWIDFFFGTTWSPAFQGQSQLGLLPLLWGTLYISFIALLVAVPVGLFTAIYLSEYATRRMRSIVKPLIEILAGIPTIVYGLFALITVGPLLRDYFAQPLGLGTSGSSVMTAGLVMGIMLIPFVSSLSDDIINAVPQSMRDASLGLGATPSETIRQVIVPAALPGIVGAILLAASRAIGETMIVVLGAGAAAQIGLNPFEAMTTITVKIVSQLTGDTDFNSPETLVAFALGLTLFVITLGLNIVALYIVRTYREQYE